MKKILTTAFILAFTGFLSTFAQTRIYTPELISPADKAFAQSPDVILDWTAVTGGNTGIIVYELYVDTDPDFGSAEIFTTEFVSGYQMEELMFGQTYYWKVRAKDGDDVSDFSESRSFNVLRRVQTTKPLEAADEQKPTLNLEWVSISGVQEYDYQFDTLGPWDKVTVPATGSLNGTYTVDASHSWIVGEDGVILFYDGSSITEQTSNTSRDLKSVYFLDASNGWAVGTSGTILFYNGTEWTEQSSSTTKDLNSVVFIDASNGWAVGKDGVIVHFNGTDWSTDSFGASKDLYSVDFADANNGWAVGKSGIAVYYDGTGWTSIESSTPRDLYCCAFLDATRGYAGGKSGIFLTYQNGAWEGYGKSLTTKDIYGMTISGNSGWAVGKNGTVIEFDGFEWFLSSAGTETTLLGAGITDGMGFVLGEDGYAAMQSDLAFTSPMAETIYHAPGSDNLATVRDLLFGTNYYFRMRTKHAQDISEWSGARSFFTLLAVELNKPNNNSVDQNLDVQLKWDKVVDGITYFIQIDDDINFGSPIPLETEETAVNAELLTFGVNYFWRVQAVHAKDASDWPEPFNFTTACCVILDSPADNATDVEVTPLLSWEEITGISGYQVQMAETDNFAEPLVDEKVDAETSSLAIPVLLDKNSQYYWRVRAFKSLDSSNWSNVWSFMTIPEVGITEPGDIPGISVYPNPASNMLYIQMDERSDNVLKLQVSDLLGKPVIDKEFSFTGIGKAHPIDVSVLTKGIYMIRLSSGNKVMTRKLVITR